MYGVRRQKSDLEKFSEDRGGGEGVAALLEAREIAEESFGYDWIATVLVADGRAFPWAPILVVMVWTLVVALVLMLGCRFDRLILEDYGHGSARSTEGIQQWQRITFLYLRGLEVCARSHAGCSSAATGLLAWKFQYRWGLNLAAQGHASFDSNSNLNVKREYNPRCRFPVV